MREKRVRSPRPAATFSRAPYNASRSAFGDDGGAAEFRTRAAALERRGWLLLAEAPEAAGVAFGGCRGCLHFPGQKDGFFFFPRGLQTP